MNSIAKRFLAVFHFDCCKNPADSVSYQQPIISESACPHFISIQSPVIEFIILFIISLAAIE